MTRRFGLALLAALISAGGATGQFPPGYLDPQPILDAAAKPSAPTTCTASRSPAPPMPAPSASSASRRERRLAAHRFARQLHADDELGRADDEGGVRSQAGAEPGVVEVRRRLGRRTAAEEPAPDASW